MALARWQATIVDDAGNIQDGATVTVRQEISGTPLANLFSDRDGLVATGNPITSDVDGFVGFHVAGGAYQITATKGGFTRVWRYVALGTMAEQDSDAVDITGGSISGVTVEIGDFLDLPEISEPDGPVVNAARVYAVDDGAGVTMVEMKDTSDTVVTLSHFKRSESGAVARSNALKLIELGFSVKDFGAVGDGVTNDTTAFAAALAALGTGNGKIYFPAGTYLLSSTTLSKTLTGAQSVKVCGDGADASILYFPNNGDGISFTYDDHQFAWIGGNNIVMEDLAFVTNVQNSGAAVIINGAALIGDPNRPTIFSRVGFRGTLTSNSRWAYGIHASDLQNLVVNDCYYFGSVLGLTGTAIRYVGTTDAAHPTIVNVHNLNMQFGGIGVDCSGYVEGLNFTQGNLTQVEYGIRWDSTGELPQCTVLGSQINANLSAILITDGNACQICNNLIFLTDTASPDGARAVQLDNVNYSTVVGNTFIAVDPADNGVALRLGSGSTDNYIGGNVFKSFATNIQFQSGANNNIVGLNRFADGTSISDAGTGNVSLTSISGGMTMRADVDAGTAQLRIHNTGDGNVTTKLAALSHYGTDTVAGVKEVGRIEVAPGDGNWINSGYRISTRDTDVLTQALTIESTGALKAIRPLGGIGYGTGAGGTVTQATSKSTGVTLSKVSGTITLNNAALAANTGVSFTWTNTALADGDLIVWNHISGGTIGAYAINADCAAGSATVTVRNITGGSLSEAPVFGFAVIKAVTA